MNYTVLILINISVWIFFFIISENWFQYPPHTHTHTQTHAKLCRYSGPLNTMLENFPYKSFVYCPVYFKSLLKLLIIPKTIKMFGKESYFRYKEYILMWNQYLRGRNKQTWIK